MNKQENQQQAQRNKYITIHTTARQKKYERANLTNRNINSRQTGQHGKQTAAKQKK